MLRFVQQWIAARPWQLLSLVALLTVLAAALCIDPSTRQLRLSIDSSVEALLPNDNAERTVLTRARLLFGDADPVVVAVRLTQPVWSPEGLAHVAALHRRFADVPGVQAVASLASSPSMDASEDLLDLDSFTTLAARAPERIPALAGLVDGNPLYRHALLSVDGKAVAFALLMSDTRPEAWSAQQYDKTLRDIAAEVVPGAEVRITGTQVVRAATAEALRDTLRYTVPTVFVLIAVLLTIVFRSFRVTAAALASVFIALIWTMATSVVLRMPLNLVTAIVPPLVITIGLSYTVHLLSAHVLSQRTEGLRNRRERIAWIMGRIAPGLALSAVTTMAGFLALLLNPLPAIGQFAVLASLGTAYMGLLTLCFLPVAAQLFGPQQNRPLRTEKLFARAAKWLAEFDTRNRGLIFTVALVMIPLDVWFATRIRTGTEFIQAFDAGSPVRTDFETINAWFDGANSVSILISSPIEDGLGQPEALKAIADLDDWLRAQPEVGSAYSYLDLLDVIRRGLSTPQEPVPFPATPAAVKQFMTMGGGDQAARMVDSGLRNAQITLRIKVDGSMAIGALLDRIEARLKALPEPLKAQMTGSTVLATHATNAIASGHFQSIGIATFTIWALLAVMFMSPRAALIATVPNLIPVAVYFGTLGALGIGLNPTTSLIACIVLGIAVNDTVHFLARFNADARELGDERAALTSALVAVLRPITLATLALCIGFLVFTGSKLHNQAQFGALAAFTLTVAWVADMTLTPALGSQLRIVTLWDVLRLDLGQSPQYTIPLLSGLSNRQARLFALVSRLETVPAGTRVIQEGDFARDIYVIVDGTVEASVDRTGTRKLLSTMTRGAVIGEAGYFGQRRTASVDAVTPVRLLRFNSQDMERLRERYPRVAATVLRNLNRVQAERIARMTAMMK